MKRRELLSGFVAGVTGAFCLLDTSVADCIGLPIAPNSASPFVPHDQAKELSDLLDSLLSSKDRTELYPEFCQEVSASEMIEISHAHRYHGNCIEIGIDDGMASSMLEKWAVEISAPLVWSEIQRVCQQFLLETLSIRNISIFNSEQDCRQYHSDRGALDLVTLTGNSSHGDQDSRCDWIYMVKRELRPRMTIVGPIIRGFRHKSGSKIGLMWSIGVWIESGSSVQRRVDAAPLIPIVDGFDLHQFDV